MIWGEGLPRLIRLDFSVRVSVVFVNGSVIRRFVCRVTIIVVGELGLGRSLEMVTTTATTQRRRAIHLPLQERPRHVMSAAVVPF